MRYLHFILLMFFCNLTLIAQVDTIQFINSKGVSCLKILEYFPNGNLKEKKIYSKKEIAKEDAFMFSIDIMQDYALDSFVTYYKNGLLNRKVVINKLRTLNTYFEYNKNMELSHVSKKWSSNIQGETNHYFLNETLKYPNLFERIEGYIGQTVEHTIPLKNVSSDSIILNIASDCNYIQFPKTLVIEPLSEASLMLKINIPIRTVNCILKITDTKGHSFEIPIEIIGYDAYANDFKQVPTDTINLSGRNNLVLKSDGPDKLIKLYHRNQLVDTYTFSAIRSEINLKGFKKSTYKLESINLSNNTKRYCIVELN